MKVTNTSEFKKLMNELKKKNEEIKKIRLEYKSSSTNDSDNNSLKPPEQAALSVDTDDDT